MDDTFPDLTDEDMDMLQKFLDDWQPNPPLPSLPLPPPMASNGLVMTHARVLQYARGYMHTMVPGVTHRRAFEVLDAYLPFIFDAIMIGVLLGLGYNVDFNDVMNENAQSSDVKIDYISLAESMSAFVREFNN